MNMHQIGTFALPVVIGLIALACLIVLSAVAFAAYALRYTLKHNRIPAVVRANHLIEARMHYHYGRKRRNYQTARRDGQDTLGNSPDPLQ
jgi:hypothetical protein